MRQRVLFHMMFEMRDGGGAARVAGGCSAAAVISPGAPLWLWTRRDCDTESARLFLLSFLDALPACPTGPVPIGLVTRPETANALAGALVDRTGSVGTRREITALYLPRVSAVPGERPRASSRTRLRPADAADAPLLSEWLAAFYRDALLISGARSATPGAWEHSPFRPFPDGLRTLTNSHAVNRDAAALRLYLLQDGRRPVAMGALTQGRSGLCRLNLLYVPEPLRRLGYGRELLTALCAVAAARGQTPMLYAAADNQAAMGLYRAAGFTEAGRLTGWRFEA